MFARARSGLVTSFPPAGAVAAYELNRGGEDAVESRVGRGEGHCRQSGRVVATRSCGVKAVTAKTRGNGCMELV